MAEVEEPLVARLQTFAPLTALIGAGAAARLYPQNLPQDPAYPAVTYQRISAARLHGMTADYGIVVPRLQIDCWGLTTASVRAVAAQVRAALSRYEDQAADPPILDCMLENEIEFPADEVFSAGSEPKRLLQDWAIWHRGV